MQGIDPSIGCSCILQWFSLFAAFMNEWGKKKNKKPQLASKQPSKPSVLAPSQKIPSDLFAPGVFEERHQI